MKLKSFRQHLIEMAAARAEDHGKKYYHGFPSEKSLQSIKDTGLQPPDLAGKKGNLTPVAGKVYCTPDLRYAIIYCLGAAMIGQKMSDIAIGSFGQYGFLAVIYGNQMTDVQPDEDSVGEMIYDRKFPWLNRLADQYIAASSIRRIMDGEYSYWAKAGKTLMKRMTDAQKHELIDAGAHVAHGGALQPDEIWKFDKKRSQELEKDGSNFFDIAERIK